MPEEVTFLDRSELLSFEEITHFVRVAASLGVTKLRLTGGEPLLRRDLHMLVEQLAPIPGIQDIGLTTNGLLLEQQAERLRTAGVHRLNVSLDTLDPTRFRELTRRDGIELVVAGLLRANEVGFTSIKVNAVAIRDYFEHDAIPLARFCRDHGFEFRVIEYMPIGAEAWEREKCVLAHEILELLEREISPLVPSPSYDPRSPAMEFDYLDGGGKVGIIASVSRPFCKSCNRIRLTADGKVRNCLFALDEVDVKPLLRSPHSPDQLAEVIRGNILAKWEGHTINQSHFKKPSRTMHAIGG
jgi:GTP 3',8-cyclase